jgi:hypothetical protein
MCEKASSNHVYVCISFGVLWRKIVINSNYYPRDLSPPAIPCPGNSNLVYTYKIIPHHLICPAFRFATIPFHHSSTLLDQGTGDPHNEIVIELIEPQLRSSQLLCVACSPRPFSSPGSGSRDVASSACLLVGTSSRSSIFPRLARATQPTVAPPPPSRPATDPSQPSQPAEGDIQGPGLSLPAWDPRRPFRDPALLVPASAVQPYTLASPSYS